MAQEQDDKIYLVLIQVEDDGKFAQCSAIKHEGKLWLVPQWNDSPTEQTTMPERIICLDGLPIQQGGNLGDREFDLLLNRPVPTSVLYGPIPSPATTPFVVVGQPNIKFRRLRPH